MPDKPDHNELLGLTTEIVCAHLAGTQVQADEIPAIIQKVYKTLSSVNVDTMIMAERPQPAVPIKRSITPDHLVCLEDGKKLKMLKRHLMTSYNMTPEEYRERWGLPVRLPDGCAKLRTKTQQTR